MTSNQWDVDVVAENVNPTEKPLPANLEEIVNRRVQQSLAEMTLNSQSTRPAFSIRVIQDHERLVSNKNFRSWRNMVELDLTALDLLPFIKSPSASELELTPQKRVVRDAQALQYIRASVSKSIASRLNDKYTAFDAYEYLKTVFGGNRLQDLISLHSRFSRLQFRVGYDPDRFVAEFDEIFNDYRRMGTIFSDEYVATTFLNKISGINDPKSPYFAFYSTIVSLQDYQNLDYLKQRFASITSTINANYAGQKRKSTEEKSAGESEAKTSRKEKESSSSSTSVNSDTKTFANRSVKPEKATSLKTKYTSEQLEKLSTLSKDEKKKIQCSKCGEYFHSRAECKNPGRMCFNCFKYGHERKDCTFEKKGNRVLNSFNVNLFTRSVTFLIDSAATHHIVSDMNLLFNYSKFNEPRAVRTAAIETTLFSNGEGTLPILVIFDKTQTVLNLTNVQLVSSCDVFIISAGCLNRQFHTSIILRPASGHLFCPKLKRKIALIEHNSNMYKLLGKVIDSKNDSLDFFCPENTDWYAKKLDTNLFIVGASVVTPTTRPNISCYTTRRKQNRKLNCTLTPAKIKLLVTEGELWHRRMGHISSSVLSTLTNVSSRGPNSLRDDNFKV